MTNEQQIETEYLEVEELQLLEQLRNNNIQEW